MSFDLGVMHAAVDLNITEYRKNLNRVEKDTESAFNRMTTMAAGYLSFRSINRFISAAIKSFSDLENASWNFNQVFDEIPASAAKAEAEMRKLYNLSETTSKKLLSDAGNQLQAFGFSAQESLTMARQIVERGIDLASYFGGNQEDAVSAIIRALVGETESMKRFSVVVQQDGKAFTDLTNKIKETTGATDIQARAQAMFATIIEQTANAAGDYLKEGSTVAQQQADLAQTTIAAKAALGEFVEGGVAPAREAWKNLLDGFVQTEKPLRNTELRAAALAAAFMLVAKTGTLAKANLAITATLKGLQTAFIAVSASVTSLVRAQLTLGLVSHKLTTSLTALNAAIGPVGWALMALSGIYLAGQHIIDAYDAGLAKQLDNSKKAVQVARENASAHAAERKEYAAMLTRLEELAGYERMNNSEKQEAEKLVKSLTEKYGNLGIELNSVNGKLRIGAEAWSELNEQQAKELASDLTGKINASISEATALQNVARKELGSFFVNSLANQSIVAPAAEGMAQALAGLGVYYDNYQPGDVAYNASSSVNQLEFDKIMKFETLKSQIAGLEGLSSSLDDKNQIEAITNLINSLKTQSELIDEREPILKKIKDKDFANSQELATEAASKAHREAQDALDVLEWEVQFNMSGAEKQTRMLTEKINDIFSQQSGKYASLDMFKSADRNAMTEQELEDLQEIVRLEDERRKVMSRGTEKWITESLDRGDTQTAMKIMYSQYGMASDALANFQREYFDLSRRANLDHIITDDENRILSDLQDKIQLAFAEQDKWERRIIDEESKQQSSNNVSIAWSSELLEAQLGRTIGPQEETAENTKQMREILRRMENKNSGSGLKYGE